LNIAFFTDSYKPNVDGVVRCIELLKKELEKNGHTVYVFAPSPSRESWVDKEVHYFESHPFAPYPQYRIAMAHEATLGIGSITKICRELKIDAVHSHGIAFTSIAAYRVAKRLNVPRVVTFHTNVAGATHYISKFRMLESHFEAVAWHYFRWLYSNYDAVLAPSATAAKMLSDRGINSIVFPNGIGLEGYLKAARRPSKGTPLLLHVGRVVKEKRIDTAMRMMAAMKEKGKKAELVVAGGGPGIAHYQEAAKRLGVSRDVKFLGFVPHGKLNALYRKANALVFCSPFDTQGLVVVEALASGMPVIAAKGTSGAEIAEEADKRLVFSNADEFEKAVAFAMKRGNCRKCREASKKYDIARQTERMVSFYREIGNKKGNKK
jgi:glycosyltransferase involved in cell wall biosynthesis